MGNKPDDILAPSTDDHYVIFGDYLFARYLDFKIDWKLEEVTITLRPLPWLRFFHSNAMEKDYVERDDTYVKKYLLKYFWQSPLQYRGRFSIIKLDCDWEGNPSMEYKLRFEKLQMERDHFKNMLETVKISRAAQTRESEKLAEHAAIYLEKVANIANRVQTAITRKEEDEEEKKEEIFDTGGVHT
jgi:hypothetical protein